MKKLLVASVSVVAMCLPAFAADLPVKARPVVAEPSYNYWDGFYVGVNGGYATGSIDAPGFSSPTATGFLGGVQVGANKQVGPIVFGMVTDIDAGSVENSGNKLGWLGTTRGKFGYLLAPNLLFYGTGGAAYGGINLGTIDNVNLTGFKMPTVGWSAGAGVEFALSANWGLGAEYLHVNLGGPESPAGSSSANGDIFRGVLNYKF